MLLRMVIFMTMVADMNINYRQKVAAEVRAASARAGVSTRELAQQLGMSEGTLGRKMRGERPFIAEDLLLIADRLQCDPASLIPKPADVAGNAA